MNMYDKFLNRQTKFPNLSLPSYRTRVALEYDWYFLCHEIASYTQVKVFKTM